jgi:hypothetical protein
MNRGLLQVGLSLAIGLSVWHFGEVYNFGVLFLVGFISSLILRILLREGK